MSNPTAQQRAREIEILPSEIEVVTLCGSTKFKREFEQVNLLLTLQGKVVITVSSFGHADKIQWTKEQKETLDAVHKRKIDKSDAIFVIDVDGYIGSSTRKEIEHAEELGLPIFYLSLTLPAMLEFATPEKEVDLYAIEADLREYFTKNKHGKGGGYAIRTLKALMFSTPSDKTKP